MITQNTKDTPGLLLPPNLLDIPDDLRNLGILDTLGDPDNPDDEYNDPHFLAREHFDFNIKGGWHGKHTPIFINTFKWEK